MAFSSIVTKSTWRKKVYVRMIGSLLWRRRRRRREELRTFVPLGTRSWRILSLSLIFSLRFCEKKWYSLSYYSQISCTRVSQQLCTNLRCNTLWILWWRRLSLSFPIIATMLLGCLHISTLQKMLTWKKTSEHQNWMGIQLWLPCKIWHERVIFKNLSWWFWWKIYS